MKVDICSLDMGFIQSCRSVLEIWSAFVCVDLDLSPAALWENLPEGEQTKSRILAKASIRPITIQLVMIRPIYTDSVLLTLYA